MQQEERVKFLTQLNKLQFHSENCDSQLLQTPQISSGYAAALMSIARAGYASYLRRQPFQRTRAHSKFRWNFATNDTTHWAYCPSQDMECIFLPVSSCPTSIGVNTAPRGTKPTSGVEKRQFDWWRHYAFRPRHSIRHRLVMYLQAHGIDVELQQQQQLSQDTSKCTAIHVRRGDIAYGKGRRYAAVDEYLDAAHVSLGSRIVLLTDDVSAVEEVEQFWKDQYEWIYLQRPRVRGSELGFEGFVPSHDPVQEIVAILAELQLAAPCDKLVHGKSGFVAVILEAMQEHQKGKVQSVYLDTQQNKADQPKMDPKDRAAGYLKQIQERLAKKSAE